MNKINKIFAVSALTLALSACNDGGDNLFNIAGGVVISGEEFSGQTLTATVQDPNGFNESNVSYQWLSDGAAIAGATSSSYILTDDELGSTLTVSVNYIDNDNNDEAATSDATGIIEEIAVNVPGTVEISGSPVSKETLTATINDENGVPTDGITYAWLAGTDVIGTDASTVTLTDTEIGKSITVSVTYTDNNSFSESVTSEATTAVIATPPTAAEFSGNLATTIVSSTTAATTGTITVTDINTGEDTFQDLTDIATTYGTFSITTAGVWTYTLDANNATISALTDSDPDVVDTISLTSFDNTPTDLLISITGAALVPNNVLTIADVGQARIVVTDTEAQETDAGISTNNGKLTVESGAYTFRFNAQDVNPTSFIALFGGKSNNPRPVVELRFDEGKLFVDNNISGDLIELVQTYVEGDWNDVEITWDTSLATDTIAPIVTLSINGEPVRSVDGTTITADTFDSFTNNQGDLKDGINMIKMNMAANADVAVVTDIFQLDDLKMINNDVNAMPTVIFDADFEDLSDGDLAPETTSEVPTGTSLFNSVTENAIVETVLEIPRT